jgi:hypothetical protein
VLAPDGFESGAIELAPTATLQQDEAKRRPAGNPGGSKLLIVQASCFGGALRQHAIG